MTEQPGDYLDTASRDRTEATVERAVALLKAYGYFQRSRALTSYTPGERARLDRCTLLAQAELVRLLAPSWTPERRAATAMLTEADGVIREIEARAREGRA